MEMECDICGAKEELVKVKNEDGETLHVCQACYEMQYEGYEKSEADDSKDEDEESREDEDDVEEDDDESLEEDMEDEG